MNRSVLLAGYCVAVKTLRKPGDERVTAIDNSWVLITGASSGFGEEFARHMPRKAILWYSWRAGWSGFKHLPRHYTSNTALMSSRSRSIFQWLQRSSDCISDSASETLR